MQDEETEDEKNKKIDVAFEVTFRAARAKSSRPFLSVRWYDRIAAMSSNPWLRVKEDTRRRPGRTS